MAKYPALGAMGSTFSAVLGLIGAGCSSDPANGAGDAGADADAGVSHTLACGTGDLAGVMRIADATTLGPIEGATVTAAGCDAATSDESGLIQAELIAEQLLKVRFGAAGYVSAHTEATPQAAGFDRTAYLFPESLRASLFTGWTSGDGYALVGISPAKSDAGACTEAGGLVASVAGHPEIAVGYLTGPATRSATLTTTSAFGVAVLGPMPPGTYQFDAVKTDCAAGPDQGKYFLWPQTMDVEADTLSMVQLKLP